MFQLDRAATVLSYCSESAMPVSELVKKAGRNHDNTIALIRELEECGLLLPEISKEHSRGRPRHLLRPTPLGEQFVQKYRQLLNLRLRSNDNDVKKALHQADLAQRLVDQQISPYGRFQEINKLARNIARTAQAHENSQ